MLNGRSILGTTAYLVLALLLVASVYTIMMRTGLSQLRNTAEARLAQSNDRFLGQVSRYQQLVNSIARHPDVHAKLASQSSTDIERLLLDFALSSGAEDIFLVDRSAKVIASSDFVDEQRPGRTGSSLANSDYIRTALDGGLGWSHGLEDGTEPRKLYFARAIFTEDGPVIGAVALSVSAASLEFEWSFGLEPVAYFDQAGVVFVTNRPNLALTRDTGLVLPTARPVIYDPEPLEQFFSHHPRQLFGQRLWTRIDGDILPDEALVLSRYLPRVELQASIFQDTGPVRERALLTASLAALTLALVGAMIFVAQLRRHQLAAKLQSEAEANEVLEARVARRTSELHDAQRQLIAASRLSALGEMSAGISHELNQPLAAMRNFAENGQKMIEKGKIDDASENFRLMATQVERIGRIIRSLRAFARNEPQEIREIDFSGVIQNALGVADMRLRREGVTVATEGLDTHIPICAGEVRLQHVIVNLLNNAIDAMSDGDSKQIDVILSKTADNAVLSISDNGMGIAEPSKVFDPFYSTKDPGTSKGMGLGLSISHGIVGSFAGTLSCRNLDTGGAEFAISLPRAKAAAA